MGKRGRENLMAGIGGALQGGTSFAKTLLTYKLQKQLQDEERKRSLQDMIQKSLLEASLKNMQLREGANLGQMDTSQGMQGVLGQIPGMFERQKVMPQTSISISDWEPKELADARAALSAPKEEYYRRGMANPVGEPILSKNRKAGTGLFGTGWGPGFQYEPEYHLDEQGNPIKNLPKYSDYELNPQGEQEQVGAKSLLGQLTPEEVKKYGITNKPYRTTKRISYKGDVIDTIGKDVTDLPDPAEYEEGTTIEDDIGNQYELTQGQWVQI